MAPDRVKTTGPLSPENGCPLRAKTGGPRCAKRVAYYRALTDTRRLVGVGVHAGAVTGIDLCRMFNAAIHGQGVPRHLSTDHDPLFEAHRWQANLRILEIDELKTVP